VNTKQVKQSLEAGAGCIGRGITVAQHELGSTPSTKQRQNQKSTRDNPYIFSLYLKDNMEVCFNLEILCRIQDYLTLII
jgi:hypothetical protein